MATHACGWEVFYRKQDITNFETTRLAVVTSPDPWFPRSWVAAATRAAGSAVRLILLNETVRILMRSLIIVASSTRPHFYLQRFVHWPSSPTVHRFSSTGLQFYKGHSGCKIETSFHFTNVSWRWQLLFLLRITLESTTVRVIKSRKYDKQQLSLIINRVIFSILYLFQECIDNWINKIAYIYMYIYIYVRNIKYSIYNWLLARRDIIHILWLTKKRVTLETIRQDKIAYKYGMVSLSSNEMVSLP